MQYSDSGSANPDEWTVSITDDDQRSMTTAQVLTEYANGLVTADTYLWRDGMSDWLPLFEVPELQQLLAAADQGGAPMSAPMSDGAPASGGGYGAAATPFAMAGAGSGATAARRPDARASGADLFGAPASQGSPRVSEPPRATGERNENSVLFSLSALTATEEAIQNESKPRASLDLRPSPSKSTKSSNGRAGLDDIMNIGGGAIGASPMLAPPDLLAPVKEPEPPPPPSMPASSMPISQAMPMSGHMMMMPQQKRPMGLIIGLAAALGVIVILVIVLAVSGGDETTAVAQNTTESTDKKVDETDSTKTDAKTDSTKTDEGASASGDDKKDDAAGDDKKDDEGDDKKADAQELTPEQKKAFEEAKKKAAAEDKKAPTSDKKDDKKAATDKKDDKPAEGAGEFSRGAAMAALGGAAGSAQGCAKPGGPTGSGKATVTFAPSGRVTSATVGGPFSGTAVGSCVASIFRGASVPPFKGAPVTVSKSFRIK